MHTAVVRSVHVFCLFGKSGLSALSAEACALKKFLIQGRTHNNPNLESNEIGSVDSFLPDLVVLPSTHTHIYKYSSQGDMYISPKSVCNH